MVNTAFLEPEVKAPEIYRNTPFEYVLTAEMGQAHIACAKLLPAGQLRVARASTVQISPPLPAWMTVAQPSVDDKTTL